ncbi:uncharacterized protein ChaoS9_135 [Halobacterium phage ChaoS9]|uniref:DUF2634 domain-containing protein n=1 Tax=Halobacterium phage ChaoS9 TaxID=2847105 RepID=A0A481V8A3_9CAUD|nr:baseplate wedge subunit [Halobacterium phage ChaoS9]QBI90034.1 uncharacterized protein ChaoS9_135 [Halobacterium phage ChaoS9]
MKFKRTLALEANGDLKVENGELVWIDGPQAVEQELKTTLATVRGEDPFDEEHGLRVFEVTGAAPAIVEREVRDTLLQDDRVATVDSVDVDDSPGGPNPRRISVSIEVTLVDETPLEFSTQV